MNIRTIVDVKRLIPSIWYDEGSDCEIEKMGMDDLWRCNVGWWWIWRKVLLDHLGVNRNQEILERESRERNSWRGCTVVTKIAWAGHFYEIFFLGNNDEEIRQGLVIECAWGLSVPIYVVWTNWTVWLNLSYIYLWRKGCMKLFMKF